MTPEMKRFLRIDGQQQGHEREEDQANGRQFAPVCLLVEKQQAQTNRRPHRHNSLNELCPHAGRI
jgi:hypothetical protein